jgi:hypothetical protein
MEIMNRQVQMVEMRKLPSSSSFYLDEDYQMKNTPRGEGFVNHCSAVHDPGSISIVATDWSIDPASRLHYILCPTVVGTTSKKRIASQKKEGFPEWVDLHLKN